MYRVCQTYRCRSKSGRAYAFVARGIYGRYDHQAVRLIDLFLKYKHGMILASREYKYADVTFFSKQVILVIYTMLAEDMHNENYEPGAGNIADAAHQQARKMARTRVVGQNERRVDARPLVTGAPAYAAEFEQPNMLHARILHSPHAHANIRRIDKSKSLALPGVRAVLTHEDLPRGAHSTAGQPYPESSPYDAYVLDSRVRYVGDWVAFVAAGTPAIA